MTDRANMFLRLAPEQKAAIQAAAERACLSCNAWILDHLMQHVDEPPLSVPSVRASEAAIKRLTNRVGVDTPDAQTHDLSDLQRRMRRLEDLLP